MATTTEGDDIVTVEEGDESHGDEDEENIKPTCVVDTTVQSDESTDEEPIYARAIVIGVDGSSQAYYAVHWYISNMHKDGNFVIFTHAFELPLLHSFHEMYVSPEMWQATLKREANSTTTMEQRLRGILARYRIPGKFLARGGRPGEVLVKVAEEEDADVIVVGTRGHGKLRRAIMGTVCDYVTHHASCPVMVCRHKGRQRTTSGSVSSLPTIRTRSRPSSSNRSSEKGCRVSFDIRDGEDKTHRPRYHTTNSVEELGTKREKGGLFRGIIARRRYQSESETESRSQCSDQPLIAGDVTKS